MKTAGGNECESRKFWDKSVRDFFRRSARISSGNMGEPGRGCLVCVVANVPSHSSSTPVDCALFSPSSSTAASADVLHHHRAPAPISCFSARSTLPVPPSSRRAALSRRFSVVPRRSLECTRTTAPPRRGSRAQAGRSIVAQLLQYDTLAPRARHQRKSPSPSANHLLLLQRDRCAFLRQSTVLY